MAELLKKGTRISPDMYFKDSATISNGDSPPEHLFPIVEGEYLVELFSTENSGWEIVVVESFDGEWGGFRIYKRDDPKKEAIRSAVKRWTKLGYN